MIMAQERWVRLGWQGISLDVPEDWCPGSLEGDHANGYLRVEDETHVRLELRWETAGRGPASASRLVDAYLKQTRKKLPRGLPDPVVDRGRAVKELAGLDHEVFTWRGSFCAHSLVALAAESRRVLHVRVFFQEGNDYKALARRIFGSVGLEPRDGLVEWAVFGFRFGVPDTWRLEHSALRTGSLQFLFRAGSDTLEVVRQSLAAITLATSPLEQWLRGTFAKGLRGFRCASQPGRYRDHDAVRCGGELNLRARPLAVFRRRRYATALAWQCEETDKLFALRCETSQPDDPRVERCADSIVCH